MAHRIGAARAIGPMTLPKSKPKRKADPGNVRDGWHDVKEYSLYVEDGRVLRATKPDPQSFSGGYLPAQIYVWDARNRVWTNAKGVKYSTARNGIYKGTYKVNRHVRKVHRPPTLGGGIPALSHHPKGV